MDDHNFLEKRMSFGIGAKDDYEKAIATLNNTHSTFKHDDQTPKV